MKPSFRLTLVILALAAILPASALAFRPAPGDLLAQSVSSRALRVGDRGEPVAELQRLLADRGFDPGPVDGIYGPRTQRAVRSAQQYHDLEPDGLAGVLTLGALRGQSAAAERAELVIYQARGESAAPPEPSPAVERTQAVPSALESLVGRGLNGGWESVPVASVLRGMARALAPVEFGAEGPAAPDQAAPAATPSTVTAPAQTVAAAVAPALTAQAVTAPAGGGDLALTLNGLPADEATLEQLLTALESRGMQATFFVSGEEAEARPELLERIQKAGHEVASLGYTALDMRRVSPMTARALLRRTQRAIEAATGEAPAYFRPPLGRFDERLTRLSGEEGLRLVLWSNVAVRPVPEMEPEELAAQVAGTAFRRAVLMLPMERPNAVAAVEPLLDHLAAAGYRSRTLSDLMAVPATDNDR